MAQRGEFTPDVQAFMEGFLGRPTTRIEMRLIPYLQYVMVNEQKLDPNRVNTEERKVLTLLRAAGHIEGGAGGMAITKDFWTFMNEVLWRAYVAHEEQ